MVAILIIAVGHNWGVYVGRKTVSLQYKTMHVQQTIVHVSNKQAFIASFDVFSRVEGKGACHRSHPAERRLMRNFDTPTSSLTFEPSISAPPSTSCLSLHTGSNLFARTPIRSRTEHKEHSITPLAALSPNGQGFR